MLSLYQGRENIDVLSENSRYVVNNFNTIKERVESLSNWKCGGRSSVYLLMLDKYRRSWVSGLLIHIGLSVRNLRELGVKEHQDILWEHWCDVDGIVNLKPYKREDVDTILRLVNNTPKLQEWVESLYFEYNDKIFNADFRKRDKVSTVYHYAIKFTGSDEEICIESYCCLSDQNLSQFIECTCKGESININTANISYYRLIDKVDQTLLIPYKQTHCAGCEHFSAEEDCCGLRTDLVYFKTNLTLRGYVNGVYERIHTRGGTSDGYAKMDGNMVRCLFINRGDKDDTVTFKIPNEYVSTVELI